MDSRELTSVLSPASTLHSSTLVPSSLLTMKALTSVMLCAGRVGVSAEVRGKHQNHASLSGSRDFPSTWQ